MIKSIIKDVIDSEYSVVIFDIDGTLKDLCLEHSNALQNVLDKFCVRRFRRGLIEFVNYLAMNVVKCGLISTNQFKQNLLVGIYGIISGIGVSRFFYEYYANYKKQICLFEDVAFYLEAINEKKVVYFATINNQNYNLEACNISQNKIAYKIGISKKNTYKKLIECLHVPKEDILIVGDNILDDWLSAKLLGVDCLVVNNYNSKVKKLLFKCD